MGQAGAFLAVFITTIGSTLGTSASGSAAVGAWKKCYTLDKPAPFQLAVFSGAPLSQMIYALIMMILINNKILAPGMSQEWHICLTLGILSGIGLGFSSFYMGLVAAKCCDAFGETNKGFTNNLMILGIIETVSLFVMVFAIVLLNTVKIAAPAIVKVAAPVAEAVAK
ncbi:MAG TPA: V-type ATP synthase subunit K [Lentisphaeria bacterium]|nr:V-type ATP synthase subunit K [Lentisphaeria bacterium]